MKPMVRSRSTVMRLVRDTPGRRVSLMLKLLAGARRDPCRLTPGSASQIARVLPMRAWRAFKSALGFWSNPEEAMQNRLRAAVLGLALLGLAALGLMPF